MNKEDLIIEMLKQVMAEAREFKQEVAGQFAKVDARFDKQDAQMDRIEAEAREFRKEIISEIRNLRNDIQEDSEKIKESITKETARINEVYGERKKVEMKWSSGFLLGNSVISAVVAFMVSAFHK